MCGGEPEAEGDGIDVARGLFDGLRLPVPAHHIYLKARMSCCVCAGLYHCKLDAVNEHLALIQISHNNNKNRNNDDNLFNASTTEGDGLMALITYCSGWFMRSVMLCEIWKIFCFKWNGYFIFSFSLEMCFEGWWMGKMAVVECTPFYPLHYS